jgi:thiamine biosynthesis protein ThiS
MVSINGKQYPYQGKSIPWALEDLGLDGAMVIVEYNQRILEKSQLSMEMEKGDQLELITFLGGG